MDNDAYRMLSAMVKAGLNRKPKLDPVEHARRAAIETARQQRRYCDAFALWQRCRRKACRRHRACGGDARLCLQRGLDRIPRAMQAQARDAILKASPHNLGAPERETRARLPGDLFDDGAVPQFTLRR